MNDSLGGQQLQQQQQQQQRQQQQQQQRQHEAQHMAQLGSGADLAPVSSGFAAQDSDQI